MAIKDVAVSSGSACTSASLNRLMCCGRWDATMNCALLYRFTIGRFTTEEEIDFLINCYTKNAQTAGVIAPVEMHKEGVDLNTVEWATH